MNERNVNWHRLTVDATVQKLQSNASCGLSRKEARSRYRSLGANTLFDGRRTTFWTMCRPIVTDPALLLMLFVCLFSLCFSEVASGLATLICLLGGVGFAFRLLLIEKRCDAQIAKFRISTVHAVREGRGVLLSARAVTVGDVLLLRRGDVVPCDCRLLAASGLRVLTLTPDENGKPKYELQAKSADAAENGETLTHAPQNMLFGGSEILDGEARAIVVAIGASCFLGGFSDFEIPAERKKQTSGHALKEITSYLRFYGLAVFVLMIPLTLLGILIAPADFGVWRVFLSFCALAATASPAFLLLHFRTPEIHLKKRYLTEKTPSERAVIKSEPAVEDLSDVTDVIALGHACMTDERFHLFRVITGAGEYDPKISDPALTPLCEAFLLLERAQSRLPHTLGQETSPLDFSTVRQELENASAFDREAMEVRLTDLSVCVPCDGWVAVLDVRMRDGDFQLYFSDGVSCLADRMLFETNGKRRPLDYVTRQQLNDFADCARAEGCSIRTVLRRVGEEWIFLGIVALREQMQSVLPSVLEELRQCGVRVSFFVQEDTEQERALLSSYGFSESLVSVSDRRDETSHLATFYGKYRVFVGFPRKEIWELIAVLKKNGRRVAVIGEHTKELSLLQNASVALACDPLTADRSAESAAVRRRADVLIPHADRLRGGLFLLLRLISDCRALERRTEAVLRLLYGTAIMRLTVSVLSVFFGLRGLYGAQILFSSFVVETLSVLLLYSARIPQNRLRRPSLHTTNGVSQTLRHPQSWLPFVSASAVGVVYAAIMVFCDLFSQDHAVTFLFCSLLLLQWNVLFATAAEWRLQISVKNHAIFGGILLLTLGVATGLSILFEPIQRAVALGAWNILSLCSLPLTLAVFWLVRWILSTFLKRTAK